MKYFSMFSGEKRKIWIDAKGYPRISLNGKDVKIHSYIWEHYNGFVPKGMSIHHKDFDKTNFNLDNLELVDEKRHKRIHAGWIEKDGKWVGKLCSGCNRTLPFSEFYERKTANTPSAKCKICHVADCENRRKNAIL